MRGHGRMIYKYNSREGIANRGHMKIIFLNFVQELQRDIL